MTVTKDQSEALRAWGDGAKIVRIRFAEFDADYYVYGEDVTPHAADKAVMDHLRVTNKVLSDTEVRRLLVDEGLRALARSEEAALGGAPEPEVEE